MLVHIVYLPDADLRGPDHVRIGKVEDVSDEQGRLWLNDGSARKPTEQELAEFQASRQMEAKASEAEDLTVLRKDELVALAEQRGVDVSDAKTKADIVELLNAQQDAPSDTTKHDGAASGAGEAPVDSSAEPSE